MSRLGRSGSGSPLAFAGGDGASCSPALGALPLRRARGRSSTSRVDDNLELRFDALAQAAGDDRRRSLTPATASPSIERDEGYVQVLDPEAASVVLESAQIGGEPVLTRGGAASAARARRRCSSACRVPGRRGRLCGSSPARLESRGAEVVVDRRRRRSTIATRRSARLDALLAIGRPGRRSLLASLAGYGLALGAALRPVEAMRRRAADLSAADLERAAAGPRGRRRAAQAGRDPERDARPPRGGDRARAQLRRRRQPRAAHAARPCTRPSSSWRCATATTTAELRAAIASAIEEADRLAQLAEDLLVVARSEKGRLRAAARAGRGRASCSPTSSPGSSRAWPRAAGRCGVEHADGPLTVEADRLRLEQALTNLVDNALRHGDGRGA